MAKTFITNSDAPFNVARAASIDAGFVNYNEYTDSNINLITFNKLKVRNENYVEFNQGYISVSGTFVYKNKTGSAGLIELYNEFSGDVGLIRDHLIGNYLISIKKDMLIYIFGDANDIFDVFYYHDKKTWIVSNNLYDIVSAQKGIVTLDECNLIEHVLQNTVINNETIFKQIYRLKGHEYIKIDLNLKFFSLLEIDRKNTYKNNLSLDEHVKELTKRIKVNAEIIKNNFDNITISMTGGLDSRVVLASYLNQGIKPNLVYGVGNSKLTNTCNDDLKINHIYKSKFDLNFQQMDWGSSQPIDKCWNSYAKKYGFLSTIYCASEFVNTSLENLERTEFIDFGYFGEPLRNIDWLESLHGDYFSVDSFLDDYYLNKNIKKFLNKTKYAEFRKHLLGKIIGICELYKLNPNKIHRDDFQLIHNEYRKGADTALTNFVNYNYYSINLLSIETIESYVKSIEFKFKEKSQLILRVLNELYPQVLEVPIFSHCEMYMLDKEKYVLTPMSKNLIKKRTKLLLEKLPGGDVLHSILSHIKQKKDSLLVNEPSLFSQKELRDILFEKLIHVDRKLVDDEVFSGGDIRHFSKYVQILNMIDALDK